MIGLAHPAALVAAATVIGVCLTVWLLRTLGLTETLLFFGMMTGLIGIALVLAFFFEWTVCGSWTGSC